MNVPTYPVKFHETNYTYYIFSIVIISLLYCLFQLIQLINNLVDIKMFLFVLFCITAIILISSNSISTYSIKYGEWPAIYKNNLNNFGIKKNVQHLHHLLNQMYNLVFKFKRSK